MTKKSLLLPILAAIGLAASGGVAFAQDDTGRTEYMGACAGCHGADGAGDGDIAKLLTVDVPDLTGLAARNDGVFPMLDVIHIIDGRTGVRGHGTHMPVWGAAFKAQAGDTLGKYGAETEVRGRILSLAYYLESIQK